MPKYSIIVPCLDSIHFLSKTVPLILGNTYEDFEIVISDNRSADGTLEFLSAISDPRLVVVQPDKRLSMQEHYEFALKFAKGEWVNLLGADDFPLPWIFSDMDKLTQKNPNYEVINWTRSYFFWPGVEGIYGDVRLSYTELDAQENIVSSRSLFFGLLGLYQILDLPQLYTCAFISMELINRIKRAGQGNFYAKSIPDIYSTIELLMATTGYLRTQRPLTLVGSSNSSLGIGNRIYLDYENNSLNPHSLLNQLTDRNLHEQKISSYYLLDCYINYVAKHKIGGTYWRCWRAFCA
jgi:glycosyltransferase involved in cell wall biosynthesis